MTSFMLVMAVNLGYFAVGLGLLVLAARGISALRRLWPSALLVGLIAWTILTLCGAIVGWVPPLWLLALLAVGALASIALHMAREPRRGAWWKRQRAALALRVRTSDFQLASLFTAGILIFGGVLLRGALVRPVRDWDSWAFWILKSRALASPLGLEGPVFRSDLYHHLEYPLFVPGMWFNAWRGLGEWSTSASQMQMVLLLLGFAGLAYVALRAVGPAWMAALGALILVGAQPIVAGLPSLYADVPLALAAAGVTLASLAWYQRPQGGVLLLVFVTAAMLVTTKSEGLLLFVAIVTPFALLILMRHRARGCWWVAAMLLSTIPYVMWRLAIAGAPVRADYALSRLADPDLLAHRAGRSVTAGRELVDLASSRPLVGLLLVAALGVVVGFSLGEWRMGWAIVASLTFGTAGFVAIYTISDLDLAWYLSTSAQRIMVPPLFAAAAGGLFVAVDRLEVVATTRRSPARRRP